MKIIEDFMKTLESKSLCRMCKKVGFVVEYTVDGMNCPICNCMVDKESTFTEDDEKVIAEYFQKRVKKRISDYDGGFKFCPKCKIVFEWGYEYGEGEHGIEQWEHGSIIYSGLLVGGFIYKGKEYEGMPVFDSGDELIELLKNGEFDVDYYVNLNEGIRRCNRSDVVKIKERKSIPWDKYN